MLEGMMEWIQIFKTELSIFLMAAVPVIELRGAIPAGIALGMSPWHAALVSYLGSLAPAPLILKYVRPVFERLRKTKYLRGWADRMEARSVKRGSHNLQRFGAWGLILFVAIPLPGTGVWTGSMIAGFLDIRFRWAIPAIALGNLLAALAVLILSGGFVRVIG